jgi:nucleoside 2-deoxyribosyltransferase
MVISGDGNSGARFWNGNANMSEKICIYLSGPIASCSDDQCMNWREYLKDKYGDEFDFIDPMRRDYRHLSRDMNMSTFKDQKKIVTKDKADICRSDAVIVWTGDPFPSVGTCQENIYAFERGKYVVTVNIKQVVLSPWLYYHSHTIVLTLDEAIDKIREFYS